MNIDLNAKQFESNFHIRLRYLSINRVREYTQPNGDKPASKETIVKPGILTKAFWVFKMQLWP